MASYDFNVNPYSSDEEEVFAGFSVEEIAEIRQRRQHQDFDRDIEEMFDESGKNSDVEFFASGDEDDEEEDDESNESTDEDAPPDLLQWSNTLSDIDVEEFSVRHGPTKDLGGQATSKDFLNLFINDDYLDEIAQCSVAYARSKGDESFVTNRAEISAYLGLNLLMGIHRLPQLEMFWDSDEFIGVEGLKKTIPKQRFKTLGKYLHLVDPGDEDANDVLCKVRSLVTLLEDKFADAYIPGKNVSVDEGLVKINGRLSFKKYVPMKPDKFGIKVWMLADAICCDAFIADTNTTHVFGKNYCS
ncbi:piggyBac transposable element-derived protein 4-like [Acropora millepora]|uniref:piggyBac transposable element-derived protein 4-like n=1 Tax=Acropora millepora TaxID=45264 RepID=UPI001CF3B54C|nr:piggyBac transposable element-derived protein 4-like [Acropora millepora]